MKMYCIIALLNSGYLWIYKRISVWTLWQGDFPHQNYVSVHNVSWIALSSDSSFPESMICTVKLFSFCKTEKLCIIPCIICTAFSFPICGISLVIHRSRMVIMQNIRLHSHIFLGFKQKFTIYERTGSTLVYYDSFSSLNSICVYNIMKCSLPFYSFPIATP